jgi:sugar O-acyltransferase (sialic acid O-acetyltransferase NeuD family)
MRKSRRRTPVKAGKNGPSLVRKEPLVVWGAGGHARVVVEILNLTRHYEIIGFLDDLRNVAATTSESDRQPFLGGRESLDRLHESVRKIVLAFGHCSARYEISALVLKKGFELVTAIHPSSVVSSDSIIGSGTVVTAGAIVNPGVCVGTSAILNTGSVVDHDCVIGEACHIAPGVHLAGRVSVGRCTWIGIGSVISDRVRVGAGCLIGAGSLVLDDIPDGSVAYGHPARVIRPAEAGSF